MRMRLIHYLLLQVMVKSRIFDTFLNLRAALKYIDRGSCLTDQPTLRITRFRAGERLQLTGRVLSVGDP